MKLQNSLIHLSDLLGILARVPRREGPETIRYPVPPGGIRPSFAAMNAAAENREAAAAAAAANAAAAAAAATAATVASAASGAGSSGGTPSGPQMPIAKSLKRPAEQPADGMHVQYSTFNLAEN